MMKKYDEQYYNAKILKSISSTIFYSICQNVVQNYLFCPIILRTKIPRFILAESEHLK